MGASPPNHPPPSWPPITAPGDLGAGNFGLFFQEWGRPLPTHCRHSCRRVCSKGPLFGGVVATWHGLAQVCSKTARGPPSEAELVVQRALSSCLAEALLSLQTQLKGSPVKHLPHPLTVPSWHGPPTSLGLLGCHAAAHSPPRKVAPYRSVSPTAPGRPQST